MARKTNEERSKILEEADKNGNVETARKHGISYATLMKWRQLIGSDGKVLVGSSQAIKSKELKKIIKERDQYKELVAEKELQVKILEELLKKKGF
jgi:putative transposase